MLFQIEIAKSERKLKGLRKNKNEKWDFMREATGPAVWSCLWFDGIGRSGSKIVGGGSTKVTNGGEMKCFTGEGWLGVRWR